jgi:hypothetical protein
VPYEPKFSLHAQLGGRISTTHFDGFLLHETPTRSIACSLALALFLDAILPSVTQTLKGYSFPVQNFSTQ